MIQNQLYRKRRSDILTSISILIFLVFSMTLKAQTQADFSGRWEFDKAGSDKDEVGEASFDGKIILEIKQNTDSISFTRTYFMAGREGFKMPSDSYVANGKVTTDNSGTDPAKKFVKWSQDKKTLTTNIIMTATIDGVAQDFITTLTYRLTNAGKTLVVEELSKSNDGERTVKKIYNKNDSGRQTSQ